MSPIEMISYCPDILDVNQKPLIYSINRVIKLYSGGTPIVRMPSRKLKKSK